MNTRSLVGLACLVLLLPGVTVRAVAQTPAVEVRARITGYLQKVHCKPGAAVKKGELLFEIDAAPYQANLAKATAQVALAEAQLAQPVKNLERAKKLLAAKGIAAAEYDEYAAQVSVAQAKLAVAQADRDVAALPVSAAKIHAPIDGIIARLPVSAGNLIKADDTVLATLEQQGPQKKPAAELDKIKELLKERREVLQKIADRLRDHYKTGRISINELLLAEKAALESGLELAKTPAERIDGLRKVLKVVEKIQAVADATVGVGRSPETDSLQARAMVLEVRIRLLREEAKVKKEAK